MAHSFGGCVPAVNARQAVKPDGGHRPDLAHVFRGAGIVPRNGRGEQSGTDERRPLIGVGSARCGAHGRAATQDGKLEASIVGEKGRSVADQIASLKPKWEVAIKEMKKWLKRICAAVGTGLTWAAVWGFLSVLIGTITESLFGYSLETQIDPLMALAMPGFIVGVVFSTVLWFGERGRRFDELSLRRIAVWGAVVGLLMGVLVFALGTPSDRFPLWLVVVLIVGSSTLLSTVSAVGSALLFRCIARQQPRAGVRSEECSAHR